jgi:hypothetical protein
LQRRTTRNDSSVGYRAAEREIAMPKSAKQAGGEQIQCTLGKQARQIYSVAPW